MSNADAENKITPDRADPKWLWALISLLSTCVSLPVEGRLLYDAYRIPFGGSVPVDKDTVWACMWVTIAAIVAGHMSIHGWKADAHRTAPFWCAVASLVASYTILAAFACRVLFWFVQLILAVLS